MNTDKFKEGVALIQQGLNKLIGGPLDYYLQCLTAAYDTLLTRYAPFKVGDRVILSHTLKIEKESGWWHCKHFLVEGASGIVRDAECDSKGVLRFNVEFDNESYIDEAKVEHKTKDKHTFCLFETDLKLLLEIKNAPPKPIPPENVVLREGQDYSDVKRPPYCPCPYSCIKS